MTARDPFPASNARKEKALPARQRSAARTVAVAMTLTLGLLVGLVASPLPAQEEELPLNFDAVAVNMSNLGPRGQVRLQIRVDRWSTDEERA